MGYLDSTALAGNLFFTNHLTTNDIFSVNAVALVILKFFELLIFGFKDLKPLGASLLVRYTIRVSRSVKIDPLGP